MQSALYDYYQFIYGFKHVCWESLTLYLIVHFLESTEDWKLRLHYRHDIMYS